MEALRLGAAQVLDMEVEDLQLLVVGQPGGRGLSLLLYDPMPGGSGLLDQMRDRWQEVTAAAERVVADCPSLCQSACVDCLLHFRNSYYHRHLKRLTALDRLRPETQISCSRIAVPTLSSEVIGEIGVVLLPRVASPPGPAAHRPKQPFWAVRDALVCVSA